jgi:uncharacterized protein
MSADQIPARRSRPYQAPWWLPGAHLQTIVPAVRGWPHALHYRRERWDTPDQDFIDIDWIDAAPDSKLLVVFHGLEGDSQSRYALALASQARVLGWSCAVVHFRGCSGELNRAPRFYHSGDSTEINWVLQRMRQLRPAAALHVAGISLGGNALLKWLSERGSEAASLIASAAAISAPLDLAAGGHALSAGVNMIYTRMFLNSLKPKCLQKLEQYPRLFDRERMLAARNLYEFDNVVTAPLHGYRDTNDYWARAAAKPGLHAIVVPTLVLNARNDPFMPGHALPRPGEVSRAVTLEQPDAGGHVGFHACATQGGADWLPRRIFSYFQEAY